MDIDKTLKQFGLNPKEINVYLALLQLGRASVLLIAKKAGIKRPTAYLILEDLMEKGLVSKIPRKHKTLFMAENPKILMQIADRRKKEVEKIIPNLLGIYNTKPNKPSVQMYEGREGVDQVYNMIMKSKEVWWFGNLETVYNNFRHVFDGFEKLIAQKKIILRDFIGNTDWENKYAQTGQKSNHEIRISTLPINIDFSLFDNKVAILSLQEDLYAVLIEDKRIADSLRSLYELAWRKAGKYKSKN
ncbi:hypothetical protein COS18_04385 [Candidatus Falkowbacteria bacterium CG02_land_8_20_14_3_00_36_14]|uniref:Transcription regulator TrmB N-terminal domain-containing protein n=1 Tax=Candidatus Falkowbacteria bacterium CG02_land_8_20_14_3_00_36_14 TaxID=1974560 RepID=A0A2M7DLJ3_9BACT|nr:MAG: hypothetical protein COS18_04385 [Candidatus Falkowbacteria bacterium CG02_land_8_20_14_3_00_36_14]